MLNIFNISPEHPMITFQNAFTAGSCAGKEDIEMLSQGFPGGAVVESLPANAGDTGSSPGLGRSHMPRSN